MLFAGFICIRFSLDLVEDVEAVDDIIVVDEFAFANKNGRVWIGHS